MSKVVKKSNVVKKLLQKVNHTAPLRVNIPAGMANAKPPLGSQLGQVKRFPRSEFTILYAMTNEFSDFIAEKNNSKPYGCFVIDKKMLSYMRIITFRGTSM